MLGGGRKHRAVLAGDSAVDGLDNLLGERLGFERSGDFPGKVNAHPPRVERVEVIDLAAMLVLVDVLPLEALEIPDEEPVLKLEEPPLNLPDVEALSRPRRPLKRDAFEQGSV